VRGQPEARRLADGDRRRDRLRAQGPGPDHRVPVGKVGRREVRGGRPPEARHPERLLPHVLPDREDRDPPEIQLRAARELKVGVTEANYRISFSPAKSRSTSSSLLKKA